MPGLTLWDIVQACQQHITQYYSESMADVNRMDRALPYLEKFVRDQGYSVDGMTSEELVRYIYQEMAEESILTPLLKRDDLEEVNINRWDDIKVTTSDGHTYKLEEHFHSPKHAEDVLRRMLQRSGTIIDNTQPIAQGHMNGNIRITVVKTPIMDADAGISASIRFLHPARFDLKAIHDSQMATQEMLDFLNTCVRYGISVCIAGETASGKTTLLNALLCNVPNEKRIVTIETGSRELNLVKRRDGEVVNNVVNFLTRPSDNEKADITQERLVETALRYNPDVLCVGEMRNSEALAAISASLSGHTVCSTIHSFAAETAYSRLVMLCQLKSDNDFSTLLRQSVQAFPIMVYTQKLEDHSRRIMDITEASINAKGDPEFRTLYSYNVDLYSGDGKMSGAFEKNAVMSKALQKRLVQHGVPARDLRKFIGALT